MSYEQIKTLLDRYFEGETTLEEEAQLGAYFASADVDDRLKAYRPLFAFFRAEAAVEAPEMALPAATWPARLRRLSAYRRWAAVAASAAIALAVWYWQPKSAEVETPVVAAVDWSKYEVTDPEEALRITKKALKRTSRELNRAADRAAKEITKVKKMADPL
jgi:hypothetical protein